MQRTSSYKPRRQHLFSHLVASSSNFALSTIRQHLLRALWFGVSTSEAYRGEKVAAATRTDSNVQLAKHGGGVIFWAEVGTVFSKELSK